MKKYIIKNGILLDKQNHYHQEAMEIAVENGIITKIAKQIDETGYAIVDAEGQYISAGMIDIHMHNRLRASKEETMEDADSLGVYRGVTTMIECGSVAVNEIESFLQDVNKAKSRYYGLLSGHGEEGFGKAGSQDISKIHLEHYRKAIENHPGIIVGLKVACSNTITNDLGYGLVKHAKEICNELCLPLTIHVGNFPPDPNGLVEFLDAGDVVTHTYHGKEVSLFKNDGTPKDAFVRARKRGVLFDVGHGSASFSWIVYDKARRKGFYPDIISTDIRAININGPAYSLAVVMSKIMNLGMSLEDVVYANTYTAAKAYRLDGLGQLKEGCKADFTFFTVDDVELELADCYYQMQPIKKLIRPKKTIVSKGEQSELYICNEGLLID